MPWREVTRMSLREEFVQLALQAGVNRRALCRRFGIAPKTGYKWLMRYARAGASGREDRSKRPLRSPARTAVKSSRRCSGCATSRATRGADASLRGCSQAGGPGAGAEHRDRHPAPRGVARRCRRAWTTPVTASSTPRRISSGRWTSRAISPCSAAPLPSADRARRPFALLAGAHRLRR